MFLARLEGASLSKAYNEYVVEGGRLITQSKNFIWKTIASSIQHRFASSNEFDHDHMLVGLPASGGFEAKLR